MEYLALQRVWLSWNMGKIQQDSYYIIIQHKNYVWKTCTLVKINNDEDVDILM